MIDQQGRVFNVEVVNLRILLLLTYRGGRGGGGGHLLQLIDPLDRVDKGSFGGERGEVADGRSEHVLVCEAVQQLTLW